VLQSLFQVFRAKIGRTRRFVAGREGIQGLWYEQHDPLTRRWKNESK
jgi:hypothetical protein